MQADCVPEARGMGYGISDPMCTDILKTASVAFLLDMAALRGTQFLALANMEGGIHVLRVGKVRGNFWKHW